MAREMLQRDSAFISACRKAFEFLIARYAFDELEYEAIGREAFVRFHRGHQTVSIAIEPGSPPIVELFYPSSETGEPPLWWAERHGVPRSRRIPRLHVHERFNQPDAEGLLRYLRACAEALERAEPDWLNSSS